MIVFVYGAEREKVRAASRSYIERLRAKRPDAGFFIMDDETFDRSRFEELIFSQGLFDKKFVVHLDRVLENKEAHEFIMERLKELAASENGFVITEYKPLKPVVSKITKVAYKTESFDTKTAERKTEFNTFAIGDALGARDTKRLWVLYTKALRAGAAPEMIHGSLFAQTRNIALIKRARREGVNANDLGLSAYPVTKAKEFEKNYSDEEAIRLSRDLAHLYHMAHGGGEDLDVALERFILTL